MNQVTAKLAFVIMATEDFVRVFDVDRNLTLARVVAWAVKWTVYSYVRWTAVYIQPDAAKSCGFFE